MDVLSVWVTSNILLWASYYAQKPSVKDFGKISNTNVQRYMLGFATLAYIANFIHVFMLRDSKYNKSIMIAVFAYYFIQLFFISAVRSENAPMKVKLLLLLACLPIYYLLTISIERKKNIEVALGVFVLFHVFINDFLLFGHFF